jgi:hypothetical protein
MSEVQHDQGGVVHQETAKKPVVVGDDALVHEPRDSVWSSGPWQRAMSMFFCRIYAKVSSVAQRELCRFACMTKHLFLILNASLYFFQFLPVYRSRVDVCRTRLCSIARSSPS